MMKKLVWPLVLLAVLVFGFQNCGYFSTGGAFVTGLSSSCGGGGADLLPVFQSSFAPFFSANTCTNCHTAAGVVPSAPFADPNPQVAMDAFQRITADRIESKLQGGHQGYNFANMKSEFDSAKGTWELTAGGSCPDGPQSSTQTVTFFEATPDPVDPDGRFKVLPTMIDVLEPVVFDLSLPPFELPGVEFQVEIGVETDAEGFPIGYRVQNPSLKTGGKTIQIQQVTILLNGSDYSNTVYDGVNDLIRADDFFSALDGGTTPALFFKDDGELYNNTDEWSISFGLIEER